jgi:hypothetical protein
MKKFVSNDDAYVLVIALVTIVIIGIVVLGIAIVGLINGISLASDLDKATCSNVTIVDTYIARGNDGFVGYRNSYFIVSDSNVTYELLDGGNITSVNIWNKMKSGDTVSIRTSDKYFVLCDQPKFLPAILEGSVE